MAWFAYLFTVAGDLDFSKGERLSTVDCLEADRLLQDSSAGPEKLFKQAIEAISLVFSMHGRYWTL